MPLHLEYRPKKLSELFGNEEVKEGIKAIFSRKSDYPHAMLFHGPTGCGKTTMARIVATEFLRCENVEEYNMSNLRGIDAVRMLDESCRYRPLVGDRKVYIIDEMHRQTKDAQNAFLKLLEEPPSHVFFILCTTQPELLLPTIRGRCHSYQMKTLKPDDMMALLKKVVEGENVGDFPTSVLNKIILMSEDFPRNALVMLDAVIDLPDEETAIASLATVSTDDSTTKELCQMIVGGGSWEKARILVKNLLEENEPERIRQAILGYLTNTLLGTKRNDRVSNLIDIFSDSIHYNAKSGIVNMIYVALK